MEFDEQQSEELASKTSRKKEMHALQEVGVRLTEFSEQQLDQLDLSDRLRNAIREFRRLPNSHGARKRQIQYIGRLMRDFRLEDIENSINQVLQPPRAAAAENHLLEDYCLQILDQGDSAIHELLSENPHLERQTLRQYFLDYSRARKIGDEPGSNTIKSKLKEYLKSEFS